MSHQTCLSPAPLHRDHWLVTASSAAVANEIHYTTNIEHGAWKADVGELLLSRNGHYRNGQLAVVDEIRYTATRATYDTQQNQTQAAVEGG